MPSLPRPLIAALLTGVLATQSATAQPAAAGAAPCPAAGQVAQVHLLGRWRAEVDGWPQGATVQLDKHPEFAETFRGTVTRDGRQIRIAGDIDQGDLMLEESEDGQRISATWTGNVVDGSCGREIRGTWQVEKGVAPRAFVLRRMAPAGSW